MKLAVQQARELIFGGSCETSEGKELKLREIFTEIDGEWRHGVYKRVVFYNPEEDKYYALSYAEGPDGTAFMDNNFGDIDLHEVKKVERTVIVYE